MEQYEKIKILGQGSYGTAFLVRDRKSGRRGVHRVIKEIDIGRMPAAMREDARAEVDVLNSLQHINVIAYYASFIEDVMSKLCIVMEFADGGDLAAAIKERKSQARRFNEDEALGIFVQCCQALQHIHSRHIMHRDLKSQNVFMTKAGVVKLGDFGIAKVLDHTAGQAVTVIGTPTYLPPEVCDNKPYGIKADIWSLGVVLYELLALEPPFQGPNLAALAVKIVTMEPRLLPCDYSEDIRSFATSCLTKQPERRPRASELLALPLAKSALALLPPAVVEGLQKARAAARNSGRSTSGAGSGWKPPVPGSEASAPGADADRGRARIGPYGDGGFASGARAQEHPPEGGGRSQAQPPHSRGEAAVGDATEWLGAGGGVRDAVDDLLRKGPPPARTPLQVMVDAPPRGRGGAGGSSPRDGQPRPSPRAAHGERSDAGEERRRARDLAAQGSSWLQGGLASAAEGGGQTAAAVRERAREEREAAEQEHRLALQEAAAQARRDRKAVQQKLQDLERGGADPRYVEVDLHSRPQTSADKDGAVSVRQRSAAAKEEQRRQHEADLEQARRAARAAQREARAQQLHNAARMEFDMTPSSSSSAPAPPPLAPLAPALAAPSEVATPTGHASGALTARVEAPAAPGGALAARVEAPLTSRGARGGRLGIAGSMLAAGVGLPRAASGDAAGGDQAVASTAAEGDLNRSGLLDLTRIERSMGDTAGRQDASGSAGDLTLSATLGSQVDVPTLRPDVPQDTAGDTLRRTCTGDYRLSDELARLCGAGPEPCSRSASRMQSEGSLREEGDNDSISDWQERKAVVQQAGATLEYSMSNDLALRSGHIGTAF